MMVERFKDKTLNRVYNAYLQIDPKTAVRYKSTLDTAFWFGYDGVERKYPRNMLVYAAYQAGKTLKKGG